MAFFSKIKKTLKETLTKKITLIYLAIMVAFLFYLLLPSCDPPQIGERFPFESGFVSDIMGEPLGTYFTNLEKNEVTNFYLENYSTSSWLNLPLPARIIEHNPEYSGEIINDMHTRKNTSFLIEINQPFRESIILKGYGEVSQESREKKNEKQIKRFSPREGESYFLTITPYQIKPSFWQKFISWLVYLIIIPLVIVFFWDKTKKAGEAVQTILKNKK
jgi:hypothetical protein